MFFGLRQVGDRGVEESELRLVTLSFIVQVVLAAAQALCGSSRVSRPDRQVALMFAMAPIEDQAPGAEQMQENIAEMTWRLHRTMAGVWVVLSSVPAFSSMNRRVVENWLIVHGCARREELDRLFRDAEEKGEGVATGP